MPRRENATRTSVLLLISAALFLCIVASVPLRYTDYICLPTGATVRQWSWIDITITTVPLEESVLHVPDGLGNSRVWIGRGGVFTSSKRFLFSDIRASLIDLRGMFVVCNTSKERVAEVVEVLMRDVECNGPFRVVVDRQESRVSVQRLVDGTEILHLPCSSR
jgi:hypothetical protein